MLPSLRPSIAGLALALATAVLSTGCVGGLRDPSCDWSGEPARPLDLNRAAHRRHLNADTRMAEELAIRHADVSRGHRSGHDAGPDEYRRSREVCLTAMVREIANRHGIQPAQVVEALGRRDARLDAVVMLLFAVIFGFAANALARHVLERFQAERWLALFGAAAAAVFISASGVLIGGLGAALVEMIQLGDMHLSYRAGRTPWEQHPLLVFLGGVVLFGAIAAIRWSRDQHAS
jgi:hypothetical protein